MSIKFPEPVTLDATAALERLDKAADRFLGLSGQEFLRRWDAGKYREDDRPLIAEMASLIRFIR